MGLLRLRSMPALATAASKARLASNLKQVACRTMTQTRTGTQRARVSREQQQQLANMLASIEVRDARWYRQCPPPYPGYPVGMQSHVALYAPDAV